MLIQAALPELAIEALHEGILGRLSRLDKVQLYLIVLGPQKHGLRGKFGAVATDNALGLSSGFE